MTGQIVKDFFQKKVEQKGNFGIGFPRYLIFTWNSPQGFRSDIIQPHA
jgi:hypothetical protein